MSTQEDSEMGYYCPLVQANQYMVRNALDLDTASILSPIVHLKYDTPTLAIELGDQLARKLGRSRSEINQALEYGLKRQDRFEKDMYGKGQEIMESHSPDRPLVVVTGRSYNLYDERLNLRLGQNLAKIGVAGLPMDFIDASAFISPTSAAVQTPSLSTFTNTSWETNHILFWNWMSTVGWQAS
ncbi:MAG: hypothetical protein JRF69_08215 [Deltaproteobacteria bacterium]|nr:hypothetical protein [Deltaproteobacteria bacterium]